MMWHVVTIEDLAEARELIQLSLQHPDITFHQARNGPKGLALVRDLTPDLVILDLMLPGMSGWDVYDTIRADDVLSETPILVLTVLPEKAGRHTHFGRNEIDYYITKPFHVQALRTQVARMLGAPDLWA